MERIVRVDGIAFFNKNPIMDEHTLKKMEREDLNQSTKKKSQVDDLAFSFWEFRA